MPASVYPPLVALLHRYREFLSKVETIHAVCSQHWADYACAVFEKFLYDELACPGNPRFASVAESPTLIRVLNGLYELCAQLESDLSHADSARWAQLTAEIFSDWVPKIKAKCGVYRATIGMPELPAHGRIYTLNHFLRPAPQHVEYDPFHYNSGTFHSFAHIASKHRGNENVFAPLPRNALIRY